MILHNDASFLIYFGDIKDCCVKSNCHLCIEGFEKIQKTLNLQDLIFLKQTHNSSGLCIDKDFPLQGCLQLHKQEGDFITTNIRKIGIGVLTGDCLPIVLYDRVHHVSAVVHVGWRGGVSGIIENTIKSMQEKFHVKSSELSVYFGPCAKICCYQVGDDFAKNLENFLFSDEVLLKKDEKLFFNLPRFVELQLLGLGVKKENINKEYNSCTMCDSRFHSFRRDGQDSGRQATVIVLK